MYSRLTPQGDVKRDQDRESAPVGHREDDAIAGRGSMATLVVGSDKHLVALRRHPAAPGAAAPAVSPVLRRGGVIRRAEAEIETPQGESRCVCYADQHAHAGADGSVHFGQMLDGDGEAVVVKQAKDNEEARSTLRDEIKALRAVGGHPHVIAMVGYNDQPILVLPRADYAMNDPDRVQDNDFPARVTFVLHTIDAVMHLHGRDWAHADINSKNVLVRGDTALLTDFGAAKPADQEAPKPDWWDDAELGEYPGDESTPEARRADRMREDRRALVQLAYNIIMQQTTDGVMPDDLGAAIRGDGSPVPEDQRERLIGVLTAGRDGEIELAALQEGLQALVP